MNQDHILKEFELYSFGTDGIGGWVGPHTDPRVFQRLGSVNSDPLTKVQLNQLLSFGHEAPVSDDFYRYYWLLAPPRHPYDVKALPDFEESWLRVGAIKSLKHLRWGLHDGFQQVGTPPG